MAILISPAQAGTITFGANTEEFLIRSTDASKNAKSFILTNLDTTLDVFVSFKKSATAVVEEYVLGAGASLNLDFDRSGSRDVFVRGTAGKKISFIIL